MIAVYSLVGPTASGKSQLAVALGEAIGAEIISLDSMMVYRGMDVGTAKPSSAERDRVRHHLIDVADPWEEFSAGMYVSAAQEAVEEIHARGRRPLFAGGTALYLKLLREGLFRGPSADWVVRSRLRDEAEEKGAPFLHERLKKLDPLSANKIHPNDLRRIVRALEVHGITGRPISELQQVDTVPRKDWHWLVVGLAWPRAELYRRIDGRVEQMFERGLVAEVRGLLANPKGLSRAASQALGYKEVADFLAGRLELGECVRLVKRRTRNFAKRQLTWFRRMRGISWMAVSSDASPEGLVSALRDSFAIGP